MIVLVNRLFLRKGISGMALWPFILVRNPRLKNDPVFLNHEKIHLRQQLEMLILPFYLWYMIEFCLRYLKTGDRGVAYRTISFEREAYSNEKDLQYLHQRSFWKFFRYLFNESPKG